MKSEMRHDVPSLRISPLRLFLLFLAGASRPKSLPGKPSRVTRSTAGASTAGASIAGTTNRTKSVRISLPEGHEFKNEVDDTWSPSNVLASPGYGLGVYTVSPVGQGNANNLASSLALDNSGRKASLPAGLFRTATVDAPLSLSNSGARKSGNGGEGPSLLTRQRSLFGRDADSPGLDSRRVSRVSSKGVQSGQLQSVKSFLDDDILEVRNGKEHTEPSFHVSFGADFRRAISVHTYMRIMLKRFGIARNCDWPLKLLSQRPVLYSLNKRTSPMGQAAEQFKRCGSRMNNSNPGNRFFAVHQ